MNTHHTTPDIDTIVPDFGDMGEFDLDVSLFDYQPEEEAAETRYTLPKRVRYTSTDFVCYDNALKLAQQTRITEGMRVDVFCNGSFIFGDFIEAFLRENKCQAQEMTISTLSLSQNNVDSLAALMQHGYIKHLNLITSVYFWGNERRSLIPYIYQKLDIDDRFQLAVADIHTKTVHFRSLGGKHIVIHGSANLRSSGNIEQFTIEENEQLYNHYQEHFTNFIEQYKTIQKPIRQSNAWSLFCRKYFKD